MNLCLNETYKPGRERRAPLLSKRSLRDDPFVVAAEGERITFSAWDSAKARSQEVAATGARPLPQLPIRLDGRGGVVRLKPQSARQAKHAHFERTDRLVASLILLDNFRAA